MWIDGWEAPPPPPAEQAAARSKVQPQARAREENKKTTLHERGTRMHRERKMAYSASGVVSEFFGFVFFLISVSSCVTPVPARGRALFSHRPLGLSAGGSEELPAPLPSRCSPGQTWSCRHRSPEQDRLLPQLSFSYPSERQGLLK